MILFQIEEPDGSPNAESDGPGAAVGIAIVAGHGAVALAIGGNAELLSERDDTARSPMAGLRRPDGAVDETALGAALLALRGRAEKALARPVTHAAIALEAPLDAAARLAVAAAAAGAGLEPLLVLERAEAAALAPGAAPEDAAALGAAIAAEDAARGLASP